MSRIRIFGVLTVFSLSSAGALAQNATTSLRGVVRDPSGAVVPGATITLTSKTYGQVLTTQSKGASWAVRTRVWNAGSAPTFCHAKRTSQAILRV